MWGTAREELLLKVSNRRLAITYITENDLFCHVDGV
jgi:hypothetical protein